MEAENRADKDDGRIAPAGQARQREPDELRRGEEVDLHHAPQRRRVGLGKSADRAAPRRGDHDVEAAEDFFRGGHELMAEGIVGDIAGEDRDRMLGGERGEEELAAGGGED